MNLKSVYILYASAVIDELNHKNNEGYDWWLFLFFLKNNSND